MKRIREKTQRESVAKSLLMKTKQTQPELRSHFECFYFGVLITHRDLQCPSLEAYSKTTSLSRSSTHHSLFNEMYLQAGGVGLS